MKPRRSLSQTEAALLDAAAAGDLAAVKRLLSEGTCVDPRDGRAPNGPWDITPLMRAARRGHLDVVRVLLSAGADVRARSRDSRESPAGRTPLHYAALGRHVAVGKELIEAGADANACGTGGAGTPLLEAVEWEPSSSLPLNARLAARKAGPDAAERAAMLEFVTLLLSAGADPNSAGSWCPLHSAASSGSTEIIEALLDAGANVDEQNEIGHTALVYALTKGRIPAALRLVERGLDPTLTDRKGYAALHWAVMTGHRQVVERLLHGGARTDAPNAEGETPLDLARKAGRDDIVSLLG